MTSPTDLEHTVRTVYQTLVRKAIWTHRPRNHSTKGETEGDGDYDFNPAFLHGQALAAETADGDDGPNTNIAHLDNSNALMFPNIPVGRRRYPSHTDLFSMAAGHNYNWLDLPRREFYGGGMWEIGTNWSGGRVPESDDDAWFRDGYHVSIDIDVNSMSMAPISSPGSDSSAVRQAIA